MSGIRTALDAADTASQSFFLTFLIGGKIRL